MYYRPRKPLALLAAIAVTLGLASSPVIAEAEPQTAPQIATNTVTRQIELAAADTILLAVTTPATTTLAPAKPAPSVPQPPKKAKPKPPPAKPTTYTVKSGDTLSGIAKANNQSLTELLSRNSRYWHDPDLIHPGQKVRLTGKTKKLPSWVLALPSPKPTEKASPSRQSATSKSHSSNSRAQTHSTTRQSTAGSSRGARAVSFALAQVGKPYVWGGEGPDSFDCSGLTQAAWRYAGVSIPRTVTPQWRAGQEVKWSQMRPGDLLIINNGHHVAMYIGGGKQVEAANPRQGIGVHRLGWSGDIIAVVRPIA